MKSLRFALLLLIAAAPLASAADWLSWRKTGDATLTWGPFTVYTSQLRTPQGRYIAADQDQALILTYARDITRDELVDATREQWQALGILTREAQSEAWLSTLATLWPDVSSGTQLAFVLREKRGQFWYRASAAEKLLLRWALSNPWRSVSTFLPSGSIRIRNTPRCVSSSSEVKNETHSGAWVDAALNADRL